MRQLQVALIVVAMTSAVPAMAAPVQQRSTDQNGSVTGIVRIPDGITASSIRVAAFAKTDSSDAVHVGGTLVSLIRIFSDGHYILENIPPGQYLIAAGRVDRPMYFPESVTNVGGVVVSVAAGTTVAGIDLVVAGASTQLANSFSRLVAEFRAAQGQRSGGQPDTPPPPPVPGARGRGGRGGPAPNSAAWWTNTALLARLGLTEEQKGKIEMIFERYRANLNSRTADLEKEEAQLARMLEADPLEPLKTVQTQIDRVIQARADMERTYAAMSMEIRQTMTGAQWSELQRAVPQASLTPSQSGRGPSLTAPGIRRAFPELPGERVPFR